MFLTHNIPNQTSCVRMYTYDAPMYTHVWSCIPMYAYICT